MQHDNVNPIFGLSRIPMTDQSGKTNLPCTYLEDPNVVIITTIAIASISVVIFTIIINTIVIIVITIYYRHHYDFCHNYYYCFPYARLGLQGKAGWDDEGLEEVVGRQSKQVGLLMHLLHWRPAFPLTHTSHSFWHNLHASLTHTHLITPQELHLIRRLAGQLA